jgi:hypothetical protein
MNSRAFMGQYAPNDTNIVRWVAPHGGRYHHGKALVFFATAVLIHTGTLDVIHLFPLFPIRQKKRQVEEAAVLVFGIAFFFWFITLCPSSLSLAAGYSSTCSWC